MLSCGKMLVELALKNSEQQQAVEKADKQRKAINMKRRNKSCK